MWSVGPLEYIITYVAYDDIFVQLKLENKLHKIISHVNFNMMCP